MRSPWRWLGAGSCAVAVILAAVYLAGPDGREATPAGTKGNEPRGTSGESSGKQQDSLAVWRSLGGKPESVTRQEEMVATEKRATQLAGNESQTAASVDGGRMPAASMADPAPGDPYAGSTVVAERQTPPDANGESHQIRVVRTANKYPLIRVDDTLATDPITHTEKVIQRMEMAADHIVVKLQDGMTEQDLLALNARSGAQILRKLRVPGPGTYLVQLPASGGADMAIDASLDAVPRATSKYAKETTLVAYAEPDYLVRVTQTFPNDPDFSKCWGLHNTGQTPGGVPDADIDAPEAWDLTTGSTNVVVGIIDTGIDYNHPDLMQNIWSNPGETGQDADGKDKRFNGIDDDKNGFVDDWRGWNFINETNDPMDDFFHGTHCAGTIGGVGNNAVGVAGVCWNVSLVALKFLDKSGSGWTSDAVEATYYATKIGVTLTSNSWGGGGSDQSLKDAIADADAHGILFVAAAGNSGANADLSPMYPGAFDNSNIICVAATDNRDIYASFSNYGATNVDLAAPGVNIYSTFPTWWTDAMIAYTNAGRNMTTNYSTISGTSMATPHVAGVCALAKAYRPSLTHAQIKKQVLLATDPLPRDLLNRHTVTDGRVNAFATLRTLQGPYPRPVDIAPNDGTSGGASGNGDGFINPGERIALVTAIQNRGVDVASGVTATLALAADDSYITVVQDAASYGDIVPGATAAASANFLFDVATNTPTPHSIACTLTVTDSADRQWEFPLTFTVYTSYQISGIVTLDGQPLSGARITCLLLPDYARSYAATSGVDGCYSMAVLDGEYGLYATCTFGSSGNRILKVPGSETHNVNFAYTTATIAGRVVYGPTGAPVAGADVFVSAGGGPGTPPQTSADGSFTYSRVFGYPTKVTVCVKRRGVGISGLQTRWMPPDWTMDFVIQPYPAPFYRLVAITNTTPPSAYGRDVNDAGVVCGGPGSSIMNSHNPWIWENGVLTGLGNIAGYEFGYARGVNNRKQVVGDLSGFSASDTNKAFFWENGSLTALPHPFDGKKTYGLRINEAGQFVGYTMDAANLPIPVLWTSPTEPIWLSAGTNGQANALNDSGQVAGYFYPDPTNTAITRACLWQDGALTDLGTLGGKTSSAKSVNNSGQVVGSAQDANSKTRGFLWQNGIMMDLGGYYNPAVNYTYDFLPNDINDKGTIVGGAFRKTADGPTIPLDELIVEGGEGWTISMGSGGQAWAISSNGCITGRMQAITDAEDVAYLLIPLAHSNNRPPVAIADKAATAVNQPVEIDVLANDSDPDGDPLTVTFLTRPAHGRVSVTSGGAAVLYEPALDYAGPDSFAYTVGDGKDASATASVAMAVGPQPKVAVSPASFDVSAGPMGVVTQTLTVSNSGGSPLDWSLGNQSAEASRGGDVTNYFYFTTPDPRLPINGLTYDGTVLWTCKGQSSSILHKLDPVTGDALGTLDVGAVCTMPYGLAWDGSRLWLCDSLYGKVHAVDPATGKGLKTFVLSSGRPVQITFGEGVLWVYNEYRAVLRLNPEDGSVLGSFTYPDEAAGGLTYFRDALWMNGSGGQVLKVNPKNGKVLGSFPSAQFWGQPWSVAGSDGRTGLFAMCSIFSLFGPSYFLIGPMQTDELPWLREAPWGGTGPAYSSATVTVTFDATMTTVGVHTASIRVASSDPDHPSVTVPVTFTVTNAANRAPTARNDVVFPPKDTSVAVNVLANDSDPDGDALAVIGVGTPRHGWAVNNGSNVTYTPASGFTGLDAFGYTVSDGRGGVATGKVGTAVLPWNARMRLAPHSAGGVALDWDAEPEWLYTLEYRTNLTGSGAWKTLGSQMRAAGTGISSLAWTDAVTNGVPTRFYRIKANLP